MRAAVLLILIAALAPPAAGQSRQDSTSERLLDGNSVAAAIYNNGFLFWHRGGNRYRVPKEGNASSIFVASLWIGGTVGGELRMAASEYGPAEFHPGPLQTSEDGRFDRIYKVTRDDVINFDLGGSATEDMVEWPWHLGAPVLDGDGDSGNYDLAAGDRPAVTGDQILWWIMNDNNEHGTLGTDPIRMEVRVTAAAISKQTFSNILAMPGPLEALDHTTFYTYRLRYGGNDVLEDAYVGFYVDTDLGNAGDDYVGSDSVLGMAFAYNGDDFDDTSVGYGERPPAIGLDFMRGLKAPPEDGVDNDRDGVIDEGGERMAMTAFVELQKGSRLSRLNVASDAYFLMQGRWNDGSPISEGGFGTSDGRRTTFMFSGDPPNYWSMDDIGVSPGVTPSDKRFLISMGPIDMQPGEEQDFILAIVWAQGEDRIASVRKLKNADRHVQMLVDMDLLEPDERWFAVRDPGPTSNGSSGIRFGLGRNHPNPFDGATTIPYQLAERVHVRLAVFDLLGREVAVLEDRERGAGTHQVLFDADALPAGIYFVRMETESQAVTLPVIVSR